MKVIILAIGFMAIFEGLMPLLATESWQEAMKKMAHLPAGEVKRYAFAIICFGLAIVWTVTELM